jgi:hypothetical protein
MYVRQHDRKETQHDLPRSQQEDQDCTLPDGLRYRFIHIPPVETQTVTDNAYFLFVRDFLVDAVFRGTVPVLT